MNLFPKQLKFEESKRSALKGFAEKHTIKATNQTFDLKTFLMVVKQKSGKIPEPAKGKTCSESKDGKRFTDRPEFNRRSSEFPIQNGDCLGIHQLE